MSKKDQSLLGMKNKNQNGSIKIPLKVFFFQSTYWNILTEVDDMRSCNDSKNL